MSIEHFTNKDREKIVSSLCSLIEEEINRLNTHTKSLHRDLSIDTGRRVDDAEPYSTDIYTVGRHEGRISELQKKLNQLKNYHPNEDYTVVRTGAFVHVEEEKGEETTHNTYFIAPIPSIDTAFKINIKGVEVTAIGYDTPLAKALRAQEIHGEFAVRVEGKIVKEGIIYDIK